MKSARKQTHTGFTLIEMLAVIVIITVLAGLVIGMAGYVQRKAAVARTQGEIAIMEDALERYKNDVGAYPLSGIANVYTALAGGPKTYMTFKPEQISISGATTNIIDPWGMAYIYTCSSGNPQGGTYNTRKFDLYSYGPDRKVGTMGAGGPGTGDDIANFQR